MDYPSILKIASDMVITKSINEKHIHLFNDQKFIELLNNLQKTRNTFKILNHHEIKDMVLHIDFIKLNLTNCGKTSLNITCNGKIFNTKIRNNHKTQLVNGYIHRYRKFKNIEEVINEINRLRMSYKYKN